MKNTDAESVGATSNMKKTGDSSVGRDPVMNTSVCVTPGTGESMNASGPAAIGVTSSHTGGAPRGPKNTSVLREGCDIGMNTRPAIVLVGVTGISSCLGERAAGVGEDGSAGGCVSTPNSGASARSNTTSSVTSIPG